jgi:Tol biopolymer transport system component
MTLTPYARRWFMAAVVELTALGCSNNALVGAQFPDGGAAGTVMQGNAGAAGTVAQGNGGVGGTVAGAGAAGTVAQGNGGVGGTVAGAGAAGTAAEAAAGASGGGGGVPVASWIFFDSLRGLNRDIYAVHADGSSLRRITTSSATEREPAVSPDGKQLAYSSDETGTFEVFLMPLPGGTPRQLTNDVAGAGQPAWSPDGSLLAFYSDSGIFVISLDGTGERQVAYGLDIINADLHPAFMPDGHSVIYDRNNQIHRTNLDTGEEVSVIQNWTTTSEHPAVSPDGHALAFDAFCDMSGNSIWIAPIATDSIPCQGGARMTTPAEGPARFPSFSPGGLIAYEHGDGTARISVFMPGAAATDITQGGDDRNPSWSPVGLTLP